MRKIVKIMSLATLLAGVTLSVSAQDNRGEQQKEGFFKQAFRDMKESAKRQREIDRANFKAQKMETRAFYEEQKAMRKPETRKGIQEQEYRQQLSAAKARQEAAQARIDSAKGVK